ncbi:MAG TPA: hypothetical protein VJA18_02555 [Candidatus Nanoarchaeia archaeon]|nr:hypothetical protein [Candidatus Nanoarchaeia archaeon]
MKKVGIILSGLVLLILLVGCVNYKSSEVTEDTSLVNEIARIEEELSLGAEPEAEVEEVEKLKEELNEVEEEVVLPDLEEAETNTVDEEVKVIEVDENEMVKLNVKVNDPDQDAVQYSFTSPLNKVGQWKTNYGDAGEYMVTLSATDGVLTTEKQLKIVVNRVNVAPVINGVSDLHVKEGEIVKFKPLVSDPNKDEVTITVSDPLKEGTFVTDHTSAGEYQIKVVASDGELETEKTFTLVVDDVNELPVLTNLEDFQVKEGTVVKLEPKVTDLDGDEVTLTISEPVGDDGVWETRFTDHGEYFVTITANDGKGTVTKKVKVVVEDVNMPPEIVEVSLAVN